MWWPPTTPTCPCSASAKLPMRGCGYVGDDAHPNNVFHFTQDRGRDGPKYFLKDYRQVLLADAYGDLTAWWPAMRAHAPDAGRTPDERSSKRRRLPPRLHGRPSRWCARSMRWRNRPQNFPSRSGCHCVSASLRPCWPSCGRGFISGGAEPQELLVRRQPTWRRTSAILASLTS